MDIKDYDDDVCIPRKKLYCYAKMIQAKEATNNPFDACMHCRLECNREGNPYLEMKYHLRKLTGVGLSLWKHTNNDLDMEFPIGENVPLHSGNGLPLS